jgi:hypothetical protein
VYLIEACPVPTPADAERLLADLWQLTAGRGLGLHLLGVGDRVMLGVTSAHPGIEEAAASTIADQCGGAVEAGWVVFEILEAASEIAAVNLVPTNRHIAVESRSFGWQRSDFLGTRMVLPWPPRHGGRMAARRLGSATPSLPAAPSSTSAPSTWLRGR